MTHLGIALPLSTRGDNAAAFAAELVREVQAADRAGLDLVLIPEHHEATPASIVAPLTLAAALAVTTERIRIGTGVLLLPVHAPHHVAEQVTMLDQLSGGRIVLGVGTGYQKEDFEPFGIDPATRGARFREGLKDLGALLSTPGRLNPRPVQRPRPPIWVGSWSDIGIRRAARLADGWMADPVRTHTEVGEMADRYRAELDGRPGTVVVIREAWVDDDPGAMERFERAITPVFRYYRKRGAAEIPETFAEFSQDRFIAGSAAECIQQVDELAERVGADAVVLQMRHPSGPGHAAVVAGIERLGALRRTAVAA